MIKPNPTKSQISAMTYPLLSELLNPLDETALAKA